MSSAMKRIGEIDTFLNTGPHKVSYVKGKGKVVSVL
jgi:hypothetical protein